MKQKILDFLSAYFLSLTFSKVSMYFLVCAVFFIPFQIQTLLFQDYAYNSGLFFPYNAFFLTFSDICVGVSFVCFIFSLFFEKKKIIFGHRFVLVSIFVFFFLLLLSVFQALFPQVVFLHGIRFLVGFLFYFLLVNGVLSPSMLICTLLCTSCFQVFIAFFQFLIQGSLGLSFLGEHVLSPFVEGVAKIEDGSGKIMRAYGTFTHPNVFGGFLSFVLLLSLYFQKKSRLLRIIRASLFLGIVVSFSRSAFLSLFIAVLIYKLFLLDVRYNPKRFIKKVVWTVVVSTFLYVIFSSIYVEVFQSNSWQMRVFYMKTAIEMFFDSPLGISVGHFVLRLPEFSEVVLHPWDIQPVHNVFFLIVTELGVLGLIGLIAFLVLIFNFLWEKLQFREVKIVFMLFFALCILGFFDHYLVTLYAGQMIFWVFLFFLNTVLLIPSVGSILSEKKSKKHLISKDSR